MSEDSSDSDNNNNINKINNININNNNNNNINTNDRSSHSGNMYSYRDDSFHEPPKESNAIRRSLGNDYNPNQNQPLSQEFSRSKFKKNPELFDSVHKLNEAKKNNNFFGPSSQRIISSQDYNNYYKGPKKFNRRRNKRENKFYLLVFISIGVFHAIMITLIGLAYEFDIDENDNMKYNHIYTFFKDIHLFIFIGFGFLYTVLKDHQWSSIFLVLFLGIVSIEFSFMSYYLWANTFDSKTKTWQRINIDFTILSCIEYNSASALVTLGALLGKLSFIQYFVIVILETFLASLNSFICNEKLSALDNGGSLYIHTFGAIFGLACSCALFCRESEFMKINNNPHITSDYYSNIFSAIGSIFLWLFFPSFNVANIQNIDYSNFYTENGIGFISENLRYRGIINTYLSMIGALFSTFIISPLFYKGQLKMEHILNCSYVGGIIIGGCCTICPSGWAAILIGFLGGTISILFLWRIKALLHSIRFEDTIGVLQIFGIPGVLGGVATSIFFGVFELESSWNEGVLDVIFKNKKNGGIQAGLQIASIFITIGIAAFSGIITGFLASAMICYKYENYFMDTEFFVEDEEIDFPEYNEPERKDIDLNSSNNKLKGEGKEIKINNGNIDNNNNNEDFDGEGNV